MDTHRPRLCPSSNRNIKRSKNICTGAERAVRLHLLLIDFSSFSLKNDLIKLLVKIEQQMKDEDALRQKIRGHLTAIQRFKAQLMELRPTITGQGDSKLKVRRTRDEDESFCFVF